MKKPGVQIFEDISWNKKRNKEWERHGDATYYRTNVKVDRNYSACNTLFTGIARLYCPFCAGAL